LLFWNHSQAITFDYFSGPTQLALTSVAFAAVRKANKAASGTALKIEQGRAKFLRQHLVNGRRGKTERKEQLRLPNNKYPFIPASVLLSGAKRELRESD